MRDATDYINYIYQPVIIAVHFHPCTALHLFPEVEVLTTPRCEIHQRGQGRCGKKYTEAGGQREIWVAWERSHVIATYGCIITWHEYYLSGNQGHHVD